MSGLQAHSAQMLNKPGWLQLLVSCLKLSQPPHKLQMPFLLCNPHVCAWNDLTLNGAPCDAVEVQRTFFKGKIGCEMTTKCRCVFTYFLSALFPTILYRTFLTRLFNYPQCCAMSVLCFSISCQKRVGNWISDYSYDSPWLTRPLCYGTRVGMFWLHRISGNMNSKKIDPANDLKFELRHIRL